MPVTEIDPLELLSEKAAAHRLGLSVHTLRAHRKRGTGIPWVTLGTRTVRYRTADVERYLMDHLVEPGMPRKATPAKIASPASVPTSRSVPPHLRGSRGQFR